MKNVILFGSNSEIAQLFYKELENVYSITRVSRSDKNSDFTVTNYTEIECNKIFEILMQEVILMLL